MIKLAIVEDDPLCLERVVSFLNFFEKENKSVEFDIVCYKDGKEFIESVNEGLDIVFMDIEMPEMNGMITAENLRNKDADVVIIFITRMAQYAIKGYEVDAFDFILKPITYPSFSVKLKKAIKERSRKREEKIQVNTVNGYMWLPISSVRYIDIIGHNLTYYTEVENFVERASLSEIEEKLKRYGFCRCSRYCLINMRYVTGLYDDYVLVGKDKISMSRRMKKTIMQQLLAYYGGGEHE